jgi:NAD(P)H-dependent flavin oxidoreductase YrpB (nitropropane dioxygenase family)
MLGIEVPVIQAPIGYASCPALAAAVSKAGGLGSLALTGRGPQGVWNLIAETRRLTDRPVVANFILAYEVEAEIDAALEAGAPIVSLFWGDVAPFAQRIRDAGAMLLVSVGSVAEVRQAALAGADAIVAQGWEAGGHVRGTVSTLALVPQAVDAVDPLSVIAAGGISDGRTLRAVLALGAQAAWVGTRFLAAAEADIHPVYREALLRSGPEDTYYGPLYDVGWPDAPGRSIVNSTVRTWRAAGEPPPGRRPGEGDQLATATDGWVARRYEATTPHSGYQGEVEAMPLWAGQGVGLLREVAPAAAIVARLMHEAGSALTRIQLNADGPPWPEGRTT